MCRHGWGTTTMGRDGDWVRQRETIDSESIVGEMTTALERDGALGRPAHAGRDKHLIFSV